MEVKGTFRYLGGYTKEANDNKKYYNVNIMQSGRTENITASEEAFSVLKEMEEYTGIFYVGHNKDKHGLYIKLIGLDK